MANEKRLIDANALWNEVDKSKHDNPHTIARVKLNHHQEHDHFLNLIFKAPTVDAVQVVHGEWTTIEDDWTMDTIYKCSVCKEEFVTIDGTPAENLWNYCPNCGAKMDGGNEDGV